MWLVRAKRLAELRSPPAPSATTQSEGDNIAGVIAMVQQVIGDEEA